MTRTVSLLFGVHAHQPAGNFASVVDEAHEKSYGPFLRTVHRYPGFRFAVHFSGWLLADLLDRYPQDMALLADMVKRGQAELFGGGDMEPVLAAIPARDRLAQLEALAVRLERAFGQRPRGAWLTERVWEATVVPTLAQAGIEFVTVDDYHFVCAGRELHELGGYFSTEDDGRRLDLFPISEQLRYRIPFAPADEVVRYMESLADSGPAHAAIYFDDIEKFGIWPETYDWVYGRRWLELFIEGVLASPVIEPMHFADYHARQRTRGIVYLPTTSYMEMGEWSLPAARADVFADLMAAHKADGTYERFKPFLRGGIWRNFLSRYPEANWMHKRMLGLSARMAALPPGSRTGRLVDLLHRAQANDAYWHGLFGGIYLPHLRRAVWNALVELEASLDALAPRPAVARDDTDLDGTDELFLQDGNTQVVVRDDGSAAAVELSSYPLRHNFGDTLTRRREHYYRHLDAHVPTHDQAPDAGIASAHDRVAFRHSIGAGDADADAGPRHSFVDALRAVGTDWQSPTYAVDGAEASFAAVLGSGTLGKAYRLPGDGVEVRYTLDLREAAELRVRIELAMPSCDGFLGRVVHSGAVLGGLGDTHELSALTGLTLEDGVLRGAVRLETDPPCALRVSPLLSVSQSEAGFEKIMQAVSIALHWKLPAGRHALCARLRFEATDA
jgi:hypothetical protein